MFMGLDSTAATSDHEPFIIKSAGREPVVAEVTVYVRESAPSAAADRVKALLDGFDRVAAAGVADVDIETWNPEADRYEAFVDAVGWQSLEPFFDTRAATGGRVVVPPPICVSLRREGSVVGLYPRWNDGTHETVRDCLTALAAGDAVENVD